MVSENGLPARTRDYILPFYTLMTRTRMPDISETDFSSKKMKIQKKPHRSLTKPDTIARSFEGGRYAMTALCRLFRSDGWRYCRENIPSNLIYVQRSYHICLRVVTRCFGANIFPGERYWQGFVGYSIAMAKRFLEQHNITRRFTEAGSWHLNFVSLSPEHRNTQTDRNTKPIIHRSYQGYTRQ